MPGTGEALCSCDFFYSSRQSCEMHITVIITLDGIDPFTASLCGEWTTSFLCSTAYPAPSLVSNTTDICKYVHPCIDK